MPTPKMLKDQLKKVPLFSSLNNEELDWVISKLKIKKYKKDDIVLFEDDSNNYMYVIIEGEARVTQMSVEGRNLQLQCFKAGSTLASFLLLMERGHRLLWELQRIQLLRLFQKRIFSPFFTLKIKFLIIC
ncbi:cyclic nucleotide-binding domain-containing protein [Candidatus Magnetomonas plexicatena]|nr:cyclic nucleotide-binding domain-containing protein [Nitrospirales bacterium LBB_01]